MATYTSHISATSHATPATEETFIELKAPASTTYLLKRIRVTFDNNAAPQDNTWTVRLKRNSAAGAATSGTTPAANKMRVSSAASGATLVGKNTTNAFTVGTNTDTVIFGAVNERNSFEWIPSNPAAYIEHSAAAAYWAVTLLCNVASRVANVEVEWEE